MSEVGRLSGRALPTNLVLVWARFHTRITLCIRGVIFFLTNIITLAQALIPGSYSNAKIPYTRIALATIHQNIIIQIQQVNYSSS